MEDKTIIECESNSDGVFEPVNSVNGNQKSKISKSESIIVYSDKHAIQQNMESFKEGIRTGISFVSELVNQVNKLKKLSE